MSPNNYWDIWWRPWAEKYMHSDEKKRVKVWDLPLCMSCLSQSVHKQIYKHYNHQEQILSVVECLHIFVLHTINKNQCTFVHINGRVRRDKGISWDATCRMCCRCSNLDSIKDFIGKWEPTLFRICSKNLVERVNPSWIFSLFMWVDNHDISIFSDVFHCGFCIILPGDYRLYSTINSDRSWIISKYWEDLSLLSSINEINEKQIYFNMML